MRSKDLKAAKAAKVLVIGEDSNLYWSETVAPVVMFADYYFREFPTDHGERSRNVEARNLFDYITYLTGSQFENEEYYFTNLCNDLVAAPPRGKRVLIPTEKAVRGLAHIEWILEQNPTIEYVVAMSMQTNYWLQKLGFYAEDETFTYGAQPRQVGLNSEEPFYQPVNGKAFHPVCGRTYNVNKQEGMKLIAALPAKDFPLNDKNREIYGEAYAELRAAMLKK